MKCFFADEQLRHDPKMFLSSGAPQPNPEVPERARLLREGARAARLDEARPPAFGLKPIAAVHTPEYLEFLRNIFARWRRIPDASAEVIPNIHPTRRDGRRPLSAVGQAGLHMADTACPIGEHTFDAACWSAWTAVAAADFTAGGGADAWAYALCRPPGHHAFPDLAGGFCFLNNAAVAATRLRENGAKRVAIIDVDLHHGNGTQGVFYARADVLTVSLHADPLRFYPFFWGHADERGEGAGLGFNLNLPLERGSGDEPFLEALDAGIRRTEMFAPDALVVALGLDAFAGDPFGGLSVTAEGFSRIGQRLRRIGLPTVLVQEGGYLCPELGDNLAAFLGGFGG